MRFRVLRGEGGWENFHVCSPIRWRTEQGKHSKYSILSIWNPVAPVRRICLRAAKGSAKRVAFGGIEYMRPLPGLPDDEVLFELNCVLLRGRGRSYLQYQYIRGVDYWYIYLPQV